MFPGARLCFPELVFVPLTKATFPRVASGALSFEAMTMIYIPLDREFLPLPNGVIKYLHLFVFGALFSLVYHNNKKLIDIQIYNLQ